MTYPDSVKFLYSLGNEIKTVKLGLESISLLLKTLGDPQNAYNVIHVAGTNGKGSTCAMIAAGLADPFSTIGLYTSPHLVEPTERIQIQGKPVDETTFLEAFETVHQAAEQLFHLGKLDSHPTYFETITAMAFLIFRDAGVHTLVCEVGLGGRLDATNVVKPTVCVITPIDFDHERYLGNRIEQIAVEKAGIIKPKSTVIMAHQRPEVERVLLERAASVSAAVVRADDWIVSKLELSASGCRYTARHASEDFQVVCPLAGEHQVENSRAAALALRQLMVAPDRIEETVWPGRLERVRHNPDIILDGAHNPAGAQALANYIQRFFAGRRIWMIYGTMRDKSVGEIGDLLFPCADELVFTAPSIERALEPQSLLPHYPKARVAETLQDAIAIATREAESSDAIFITGSLFLVGEARKLLGGA